MEYSTLTSGYTMPMEGMGTNTFGKVNHDFYAELNYDTTELKHAYDNGYRLFDTAIMYRNEAVLGKFMKEYQLPREDLFITSKIPGKPDYTKTDELVLQTVQGSLQALGTDYIDLYLIHHPWDDMDDMIRVWKALEGCVRAGQIRSIGVSNFTEEQLQAIIQHGTIRPAVNQIESNPANWNHGLISFCQANGIVPQAWSPLKKVPESIKDQLARIGTSYGKSWSQVLLRYQLQRQVAIIPKSHSGEHQKENIEVFDFILTSEHCDLISSL